jgi:GntR family transcriptional regulator of arabinose operon
MRSIETKLEDQEGADSEGASKVKQPKYLQIVESLRSGIAGGKYRDGSRLPSEAELVRKFNVSRMTVVKAMQQLRQEGLLVRRTGSGTYAAESSKPHNPVFGLMIPDLGDTDIFEPICKGMARSPGLSGHSLSWGHSLSTGTSKEEDIEHLCLQYIDQKVSGVFFAPVEFSSRRDQVNRRILKSLQLAGIPVVLLDRCILKYPERSEYDVVSLDNRRAGYVVADHLIRQGAQHIAFLARPDSAETVDDRITGYREALFTHGLNISNRMLLRSDGSDAASIQGFLKRNKVDAIQCGNDITAAHLMRTLIGIGVRVPEDIRIAGVDDVKYGSLLPVPLTTFHQPCSDIGAAAVAAMKERIGNPQLPGRSILLNGRLVVRKSCGAAVGISSRIGHQK